MNIILIQPQNVLNQIMMLSIRTITGHLTISHMITARKITLGFFIRIYGEYSTQLTNF
jgi:hypothetical protein